MKQFILTLFFAIFLVIGMEAQQKFNYTQAGQQLNLDAEVYDTFIKKHREAELLIQTYRDRNKGVADEDIMEVTKLKMGLIYDMQKILDKEKYHQYMTLKEATEGKN